MHAARRVCGVELLLLGIRVGDGANPNPLLTLFKIPGLRQRAAQNKRDRSAAD